MIEDLFQRIKLVSEIFETKITVRICLQREEKKEK